MEVVVAVEADDDVGRLDAAAGADAEAFNVKSEDNDGDGDEDEAADDERAGIRRSISSVGAHDDFFFVCYFFLNFFLSIIFIFMKKTRTLNETRKDRKRMLCYFKFG